MSSFSPLPRFSRPPVIEVALSVTFDSIDGLSSARAGRLWHKYPEYPQTQDHQELEVAVEEPGVPKAPSTPNISIERVPRVRTWFLTANGTQLVQVQHNRFIYNWRRANDDAYPSYERVRNEFRRTFQLFLEFLREEGLSSPRLFQCDATYVNHISRDGGPIHGEVGSIFRVWNELRSGGFLPASEDTRFLTRYVIPREDNGSMLGRLAVNLQPAYVMKTGKEILTLTMLARGEPLSPDIDGAIAFLDIAHEWIVRGFVDLTTPEMHQFWGLQR